MSFADEPLSLGELENSLQNMANNKVAGIDTYPVEFNKQFSNCFLHFS